MQKNITELNSRIMALDLKMNLQEKSLRFSNACMAEVNMRVQVLDWPSVKKSWSTMAALSMPMVIPVQVQPLPSYYRNEEKASNFNCRRRRRRPRDHKGRI